MVMRIIVFFFVSFPVEPRLWAPIRCHASESLQRDTRTAWTDYSEGEKHSCLSSGFNVLLHVTPRGKTQEKRPNSIQQKKIYSEPAACYTAPAEGSKGSPSSAADASRSASRSCAGDEGRGLPARSASASVRTTLPLQTDVAMGWPQIRLLVSSA